MKPDPSEFRVPASDTKGHSARQWFRCIPMMSRQVDQIIQTKNFPYRTKGDLLRHALHKHMQWLQTLNPMDTVSGQVDAILEIMRDEEMSNDFTLVFEKMKERVSQHLASGSQKEAMRLIITINGYINSMPSGFWKDRYRKQMKSNYGEMLEDTTKCNLGNME